MRAGTRRALVAAIAALWLVAPAGQELTLPVTRDSVKFAVIGDSGTGGKGQYAVAQRIAEARQTFPFDFVIMLGDNIYGDERPEDFEKKFERPYKPLLEQGVTFHAALGNHDDPNQRFYRLFNMNGERYYTFSSGPVAFFVLDSTYMDPNQLDWLERELQTSRSRWKIAYLHHPLYSSGGRHGSETDLRALVEPLFLKHGVNAVFAGHEHFYERIQPQKGIYYFTAGGSAKLRRGNIRRGALTAAGFDRDLSFMLVEVAGDDLHFQTISRKGATVDSGVARRTETSEQGR